MTDPVTTETISGNKKQIIIYSLIILGVIAIIGAIIPTSREYIITIAKAILEFIPSVLKG